MKRILSLSIFALLTLAVVNSTQAQSRSPREATSAPSMRNTTMDRLESTTERVQLTQEEREEKRTAFQEKLEGITDIRRQAMIERVDEKINNFNERHTTKLQNGLTRMQTVLDKISTKAATLNNEELDTQIETAQTAIDEAQEAITAQLENEYILDLTDETSIRSSGKELFMDFKTNLKAVHELVKEAHMAVVTAARMLPKSTVTSAEDNSSTEEADTITPSMAEEEN